MVLCLGYGRFRHAFFDFPLARIRVQALTYLTSYP